jgi:hypothetical protein
METAIGECGPVAEAGIAVTDFLLKSRCDAPIIDHMLTADDGH